MLVTLSGMSHDGTLIGCACRRMGQPWGMSNVSSPLVQVLIAVCGAGLMLLFALLRPEYLLLSLPLMVLVLGALAFYQFPQAIVALLVVTYGLPASIIQLDGGNCCR